MSQAALQSDERVTRCPAQCLTFLLGHEEYGIDILEVQEIRRYTTLTQLPRTPDHVRGVMNLRGAVVPVVDLRKRLGLDEQEYTRFTVIIVVRVGTRTAGILVDAVSDVLDLENAALEPPPDVGGDSSFMTGIARSGERLITMLQVARTLGFASIEPH